MSKKVYLFKGLPASGKSTEARRMLDENPGMFKRVNKDDLRSLLDNNHWSKPNEKFVLKLRDQIILQALEEGKHVLIDDTNLHPKHEMRIRELVQGLAEVIIMDFLHVDLEACIERDLKRPNSVGERVIRRMWQQHLEWNPVRFDQDPSLPRAIICDMDGTLALLNGRNPYDASTCDQDLLNEPVAAIVRSFQERGHVILFLTGREDKYEEPSIRFIKMHFGEDFPYLLIMRKTEDPRKDAVIKRELFDTCIQSKYFIDFVLDDRNQTVDMWRALGLTCLQVNYGDF